MHHPDKQAEIIFKNRLNTEANRMQVKLNRQIQVEERWKLKQFQLIRWDLLKQRKEQLLESAIRRNRQSKACRLWALYILSLMQIKKVSAAFFARKWQLVLEEKRVELVKQVGLRWKRYMLRITPRAWVA